MDNNYVKNLEHCYHVKVGIEGLVRRYYRSMRVIYCHVEGSTALLTDSNHRKDKYPYVAKRILQKYPELTHVHFTGEYMIYVYTRNTLKWIGL